MNHLRALAVMLAAGAACGVASAQVRLEGRSMPPGTPSLTAVSPPFVWPGDNLLTQVNVNGAGMNVIGDAGNEPSMGVDPAAPNRIVIGWRQFDTITSNFRQAGRAFSRDGGRTWTNPGVLEPGVFRSDPVVRVDQNGVFRYLSLTNAPVYACVIFSSTDGGATFSNGVPAVGGDKQWFCIDTTNSVGRGFMYQAWSPAGGPPEVFSRSTDGGATWMTPIQGTPVWGQLDVNTAGDLFIGGVNTPGVSFNFRCARSTNAKIAAQTPVFTNADVNMGGTTIFTAPINPDGLGGQINLAVDRSGGPRDGWVYMVATVNPPGTDPADITFNRSADGGVTWLANPIKINNDPVGANNWQWFGTMGLSPNGRIDVTFFDTRESLNPLLNRLYYAFSTDGGTTWQGNTPVTPQFDVSLGYPMQNKIGDYCDLWSDRVGAFVAFPATFTGGEDVYCLRINDYDCNGNGIPDATDLAMGIPDCNGNGIPDSCELAAGVSVVCACYANCDGSTLAPVLNVNDFTCFLNRFAAGDPAANCDGSTAPPVLNVNDFICFNNAFAAGCP